MSIISWHDKLGRGKRLWVFRPSFPGSLAIPQHYLIRKVDTSIKGHES
jgi:hypothetical protein